MGRYSGLSSDGGWSELFVNLFARIFAAAFTYFIMSILYSCAAPHIEYRYTPEAEQQMRECVASSHSGYRVLPHGVISCMAKADYSLVIDTVIAGDPTTHRVASPLTPDEEQVIKDCINPEYDRYHFYVDKAFECLHNKGYYLVLKNVPVAWEVRRLKVTNREVNQRNRR